MASLIFALVLPVSAHLAQTNEKVPAHSKHAYSKYEELVYENVTEFHKNFDTHEWEKNGPLVADNLQVNSNGTELHGREEYVKRIARFAGPFPDVQITDLDVVVDGNQAAVRFIITGTQTGDLPTPTGVLHATGRKIKVNGVEYLTFNSEGKITDLLTVEDLAGMMGQLTDAQ